MQWEQRRGASDCVRSSRERLLGEQTSSLFQALPCWLNANTVPKSMGSSVRQTWAESLLGYLLVCEFEQISYSL